jgi:hypothetical protein
MPLVQIIVKTHKTTEDVFVLRIKSNMPVLYHVYIVK